MQNLLNAKQFQGFQYLIFFPFVSSRNFLHVCNLSGFCTNVYIFSVYVYHTILWFHLILNCCDVQKLTFLKKKIKVETFAQVHGVFDFVLFLNTLASVITQKTWQLKHWRYTDTFLVTMIIHFLYSISIMTEWAIDIGCLFRFKLINYIGMLPVWG